jgi:hypothetical protein
MRRSPCPSVPTGRTLGVVRWLVTLAVAGAVFTSSSAIAETPSLTASANVRAPGPGLAVGRFARAGADTTGPPQLLGLSIAPRTVDVSGGSATVTITLAVSDPGGSGLAAGRSQVTVTTPDFTGFSVAHLVFLQGSKNRYTATFTFGRFAVLGEWDIWQILLPDKAGAYQAELGTSDLAQAGFPTSFTVAGPPPDVTPPVLESMTGFAPTNIDLSNGPVTSSATLRVTDDDSGVAGFVLFANSADPVQSSARTGCCIPAVTKVSADTYRLTLTFPADSPIGLWARPTGLWELSWVDPEIVLEIYDNAGNFARYTLAEIEAAGASGVQFVVSRTLPPIDQSVTVDQSGPPTAATRMPVGSTLTWNFPNPQGHGIVDLSGMNLYGARPVPAGGSYAFKFDAAGTYRYRDPAAPGATGKVEVPIQVEPEFGPLVTYYNHFANVITVTWAAGAPQPGYVYDVQMKRPGASGYTDWLRATVQPKATFQPDAGPGTYAFQARLRKLSDNTSSAWSPQRWFTSP